MGVVVLFLISIADLLEEQDPVNWTWALGLFSVSGPPRMPVHTGPGFCWIPEDPADLGPLCLAFCSDPWILVPLISGTFCSSLTWDLNLASWVLCYVCPRWEGNGLYAGCWHPSVVVSSSICDLQLSNQAFFSLLSSRRFGHLQPSGLLPWAHS